jgi:hypothetical protein
VQCLGEIAGIFHAGADDLDELVVAHVYRHRFLR